MAHRSRLRILTWNIHHGVGTDGRYDLDRIAREIGKVEADIVCLQEVDDRFGARTNGEPQPARLAAALGMDDAVGHALPSRLGTDGGYGNVVLATSTIEAVDTIELDAEPDDAGEPRVLVSVELDHQGTAVTVWCTHLDHASPANRSAQVCDLVRRMGTDGLPTVLAGDLNATPSANELAPLRDRLQDPFDDPVDPATFPALAPERRIDYLLVDPCQVRVDSITVPRTRASDHRPVMADFVLIH